MSDTSPTLTQRLAALIDQGLTFGQSTQVFADRQSQDAEAVIERARDCHGHEGEIEIDQNAIVSASEDGGDYVTAWVWVPHTSGEDDQAHENEA